MCGNGFQKYDHDIISASFKTYFFQVQVRNNNLTISEHTRAMFGMLMLMVMMMMMMVVMMMQNYEQLWR